MIIAIILDMLSGFFASIAMFALVDGDRIGVCAIGLSVMCALISRTYTHYKGE